MYNRSTTPKTSKFITENKTTALGVRKSYNRSSEKQSYHDNCVRVSPERQKPVLGKLNSPQPKLPNTLKKTTTSQKYNLKQVKGLNLVTKPKTSLSQEEVKNLNSRFEQLSAAILKLASSKTPFDVQSLETLLTKEITDSLGDEVNSPKFSQGFIQATRNLLDHLINEYEEGRVQPQLVKDCRRRRPQFLRASSATSVCYRDRYFKELVMNVLQSMSSNVVEEETTKAVNNPILSEKSKERIRAIRDIVRAEAGLEPETFHQLDQRLTELRRSLSQNKLDMLRAAREVERVISEHLLTHDGCCESRSSSDCVIIPKTARDALRGTYNRRGNSLLSENNECRDDEETDVIEYKRGCLKGSSSKQDSKLVTRNCSDNLTKFQDDLNIFRIAPRTNDCSRAESTDSADMLRPQITKIVQEEILRVEEKKKQILNLDDSSEENSINNSLNSSSTSFDSLSDDEDDEITAEETRMFLEALKADIEQKKRDLDISDSRDNIGLETIDEDEETRVYLEELRNTTKQNKIITESKSWSNFTNSIGLKISLSEKLSSFSTPVTLFLSPINLDYAYLEMTPNIITSVPKPIKQMQDGTTPHHVRSKWCMTDHSEAGEIMTELTEALERFKIMSDNAVHNIKKTLNENIVKDDTKESINLLHEIEYEFTVEEMANILMNLSIKIDHLPDYMQESVSNFSSNQKEQLFSVFTILENCLSESFPIDLDAMAPLKDEEQFSLSIKNISKTFSFLSDTLSHAPCQLKTQPISVITPPESLTKTLAILASTGYFRDCFISAISRKNQDQVGKETFNAFAESLKKNSKKQFPNFAEVSKMAKGLQLMKEINVEQQTSSREILPQAPQVHDDLLLKTKHFKRITPKHVNVDQNITNFEHYLGLTSSVMTLQNLSDMFLFLSTVLNDVPDRIKTEKILSLKPPATLLRALEILYSDYDEESLTYVEKKTSFASLTVQNASDFFLTVSKTFKDAPTKLRDSVILDLDPPPSLLRAISLLTSLSLNSVLESRSQEELEGELHPRSGVDSQEKFFDAVDSLTSLQCV